MHTHPRYLSLALIVVSVLMFCTQAVNAEGYSLDQNPSFFIDPPQDSLIQELIEQVSDSIITDHVQHLQDFRTRYQFSDSIGPAGQWIHDQLISFGFTDVVYDSFMFSHPETSARNIVATKPGITEPEKVIVIGGHYDSIAGDRDPDTLAPGADDNATGCAATLEIARVLADVKLDQTVVFVFFAAEEVGLSGSGHYAREARLSGVDITLMICLDMFGYQEFSPWNINVFTNMESYDFAVLCSELISQFSNMENQIVIVPYGSSDDFSFQDQGFHAIALWEGLIYPYMHSYLDIIDHLTLSYTAEVARAALATVVVVTSGETSIEDNPDDFMVYPRITTLKQNYPNPFNPSTTISFNIPHGYTGLQQVSLKIYDLRGKQVRTLLDSETSPGSHKVVWLGKNDTGDRVPSGIYLYSLNSGERTYTRKMVLLQ
jgi:hypothetical protein